MKDSCRPPGGTQGVLAAGLEEAAPDSAAPAITILLHTEGFALHSQTGAAPSQPMEARPPKQQIEGEIAIKLSQRDPRPALPGWEAELGWRTGTACGGRGGVSQVSHLPSLPYFTSHRGFRRE